MRIKKSIVSLVVLLVSYLIFYFFKIPPQPVQKKEIISPKEVVVSSNEARVIRVIDGDTIEIETKPSSVKALEGRQKVRYIGIDTPELHDPKKPVQCFSKESFEINKKLVEGKVVSLEKDISEKDKYGRLLRYVFLPQQEKETTSSGFMINDYLVRQGYGHAVTFPPDIKYQEQFRNAQKEARDQKRGFWSQCRSSQ